MDLKSAKVLVTGGNSGIGLETARQLLAQGAQVVICGRDTEKLEKTAQETGAIAIATDVSQENEVMSLVKSSIEKLGSLNVLINNAGFGYFAPLTEINRQEFDEVIATNVTGAMMVAREVSRHFIKNKSGNIINVASTAGSRGFASGSAYCATKFALTAMTECWRAELREHNIRVMQVNPSEVQTSFVVNSKRSARSFNPSKLQAADIAQTIVSMLQLDDRAFITDTTVWATNPQS